MNFDKPVGGQLLKRKALNVDSCVPRKKRKKLYTLQGWTVEKDWNVEEAKLSNNNNYIIEKKNEDNKENAKPKNKELKEKYKASTKTTTTTTTGETKNTSKGPLIIKTSKVVRKKIPVKANTIVESSNAKVTENEVAPIRSADNQELNPPAFVPEKTINEPETPVKQFAQPVRQSQRSSVQKINSVEHPVIIDETIDVNHNDMTITETHPVVKNVPINSTMPFYPQMRELKIVLHRVDEKQSTIQNQMKKNKELAEKTNFDIKTTITKYTPAANTKSFLDHLDDELIGTKIPIYVKKILIKHRFDNPISFAALKAEIFKEIEDDENDGKEIKFKFVSGDKKLLEHLVQIVKDKGQEYWNKLITEESEMDDLNDGANNPDDKPPRKPLDENRKPKMIDPSAATIERLIEAKCYVDKTENVMNFLNDPGHKVFTRPRRFGKTLFLDTVELVCNCEKELFAECFIGDSKNGYEWKKYPVIKLNFSEIFKGPDLKSCQHLFIEQLQDIVRKENIDLKVDEYDDIQTFKNLVVTLNNKYHSQVVLLIDEYDHLLTNKTYEEINNMKNDKNENEFKFLKSFFNTIKYIHKNYLHLVLCTGVVKSSYNDIFSGGNNDTCLDYKTGYDTMIGFTETEIKNVFGFAIKEWANSKPHLKLTQEIIMNELKINYNGYSFDAEAKQNIYNSWSITKSLYFKDFDAYWMEPGSPTVLMNKISADPRAVLQLPNLSRTFSLSDLLSNYKATSDLNIMMFQLGYLTLIKQQTNESNVTSLENVYNINYPNQEVKKAFTRLLLKHMYSQNVLDEIELNKKLIVQELKKQNSVPLIEFINKHLPNALSNSASEKRKDGELYEKTYNSYIYAIIQSLLGNCELQQSITGKKLDLIIKLGEAAFVIEMKVLDNDKKFKKESYEERKKRLMKSAYDALEQIENNKYYEEHKSNDKLQVLGMIFSNNKIAAIKYGNKISYVKNKLHFDDFRDFFFEDEVIYGRNMNIKNKRFIK